jgi:hypothetical protein
MIEINVLNKEYEIKELEDILVAEASKGVLLLSPFSDVRDIGPSITQLEQAEDICIERALKYQKLEATRLIGILNSFGNSNVGKTLKEYFSKGMRTELYRGILFQPDLNTNHSQTENIFDALEMLFGNKEYYLAVPKHKIHSSVITSCSSYPGRFLSKKLII